MKLAFYKGRGTLFNRIVCWWQRGPYSHVEVVLATRTDGTYECASSVPGVGVRIATKALPAADWDFIDYPADVGSVRAWFAAHAGAGYDYLGIFGFIVRPVGGEPGRYFCAEAIATALGIDEPWRLDPNGFADFAAAVTRTDRTAA